MGTEETLQCILRGTLFGQHFRMCGYVLNIC